MRKEIMAKSTQSRCLLMVNLERKVYVRHSLVNPTRGNDVNFCRGQLQSEVSRGSKQLTITNHGSHVARPQAARRLEQEGMRALILGLELTGRLDHGLGVK